jgi:CRP-like cAMP-binding protein
MPVLRRPWIALARVVVRKFKELGEEELSAFLPLVRVKEHVERGGDIVEFNSTTKYSTILLGGVACRYKLIENGRRQILTFHYPGDFCDLNPYVRRPEDEAVVALCDCSIGIVSNEQLARVITQYPKLRTALWQEAVLEGRIIRERLVNVGGRSAQSRIANLLCEQIARLEAIGTTTGVIPLMQVDLADAAALSVVHVNRTIQDLRELGVLSKSSRVIHVMNKDRLVELAKFDSRYLEPQAPPQWELFPAVRS